MREFILEKPRVDGSAIARRESPALRIIAAIGDGPQPKI
jgi:hypothetical protein